MKQRLRIGELAAGLGINPKTIRYYEALGLLPQPPRTEAGYRQYRSDDAQRLAFIGKAKQLGLSLQEVADILALRDGNQCPCAHVRDLVGQKLIWVDEQLAALRDFRRELLGLREEANEQCEEDAGVCAIIEHHAGPTPVAIHPRRPLQRR